MDSATDMMLRVRDAVDTVTLNSNIAQISQSEINTLEAQGNRSSDWSNVFFLSKTLFK
jgi:hypothetical protein